jgi:hypothetical protein
VKESKKRYACRVRVLLKAVGAKEAEIDCPCILALSDQDARRMIDKWRADQLGLGVYEKVEIISGPTLIKG